MSSRRWIIVAMVVALCFALLVGAAACGSSGGSSTSGGATGKPVKGGILRVTYSGEPQYLDPAIDWETQGWEVEHCLFNTLLTYVSAPGAEGTKLVPDLATEVPTTENGGITNGGKTITFHLRHGIKFAPPVNREMTAQDFKYSVERMMNPKTQPAPPGTQFYMSILGAPEFNAGKTTSIPGIKVVDPYTIEIDLSKPDATILSALTMSFTDVVPKEWVQKWGTAFVRHPLGTGPYMLDHWTAGQDIVLKRNPNWFDWRGVGQAWVDGIDFKIGATPSVALLQLKTGNNDLLGDYIAPSDYVGVTHDPVWSKQVANVPAIAFDYLFMNVQMKPFDNLKVRQAVECAINRDKLVKLISGAGTRTDQIYPVGMLGHVDGPAGVFYTYDPTKAKQLLAEAGYPHGFSTTMYSHNIDPWPKVSQSIQNDLAQVGIKVAYKPLERATYWTLIGTPHKVALGLQDWWQDFPDPVDFVVSLFSKSNAVMGGANPSFWWDPTVEKELAASFAIFDKAQRAKAFDVMQQQIMAQAPAVPLYSPNVNTVFSQRTHGVYIHPVWSFDFIDYWISK